ncbi:MAG: L-serine ammonia-lyase [Chloroflexi bacterium HGW-Chloroflexi-10]|nr:MAG: L-serine ammonia-lyase [Chloroflexi bacterium HGW-Chloroflexi-10]
MESIRELFRIGHGPSSSHTIGPGNAAIEYKLAFPEVHSFRVTLFGSLAATGRGHLTDKAIQDSLSPAKVEFIWKPEINLPFHPNGFLFEALSETMEVVGSNTGYSIGGGTVVSEGSINKKTCIYPHGKLSIILKHCTKNGLSFWEYVELCEGKDIWDFLSSTRNTMHSAIERGLEAEGVLPGGLGIARKASLLFRKMNLIGENFSQTGLLPAYALAVAEENASGGITVTAPTCGSSGVLPAVIRYIQDQISCSEPQILKALATAGLIGNLIKHNASISGAEVGCQGEIGSACAMAAAAAVQLLGGTIRQIEYAAEMGLEHHLGLTCDPVGGLVQIPCIERNAFAATRAMDCARYALFSDGSHRVSFDEVVNVMKQTGHDLPSLYRETARGGLATAYRYQQPVGE